MERFLPEKYVHRNQAAIKSGVAYGLGWVGGTAVSSILINRISLIPITDTSGQAVRLIIGILLAFFIAGIGAAIAGFAGGYTLPVVRRERGRWGYALRSALVIGIIYGIVLYPIGFILSLFIFYANGADIGVLRFFLLFLIIGAIYGALVGFFLAIATVGRHGMGQVVRASTVGFGLGGGLLGIGMRQYLLSFNAAVPGSEQRFWLLLGILFLGICGGYGLGHAYHLVANRPDDFVPDSQRRIWARRIIALILVLFLIFAVFRPIAAGLADFLTPVAADLDSQLNSNTIGTHWSPDANLTENETATAVSPDIAAIDGRVALTYAQEGSIIYRSGQVDEENGITVWNDALSMPASGQLSAVQPQIALDSRGVAHLVWAAETDAGQSTIFYTQCTGDECTDPVDLSASEALACAGSEQQNPTIAVNAADTVMVVWESGGLPAYSTWVGLQSPETGESGCISDALAAFSPRISGSPTGFALAFADSDADDASIQLANYQGGWQTAVTIGNGRTTQIFEDGDGRLHLAWCGEASAVTYWSDGSSETLPASTCAGRPEIAQDSQGRLHLLWFADEVENNFGIPVETAVIQESVRTVDGRWQPPIVAINPAANNKLAVSNDPQGTLYLTRDNAAAGDIFYSTQMQYSCEGVDPGPIAQIAYDVARQETYRPEGTIVPYCGNRFDRLLYTPNPDPAFSDLQPTPNGAFDYNFDLVRQAQYEVLFSTMWYDADAEDQNDSPGSLLAAAVADLYDQISQNPQNYPKGMTVRIMLGNPPEVAKGDFTNQLWNVLNDLRDAGVPEMVNEEIGWRLEVADYGGAFPHSHTKTLIVDGKTAVAAGYNMSYAHFPADHPSGKGAGRNDLGMQITGPVAQDTQRMFDDLWSGSDKRHCTDFDPVYLIWQATCWDSVATADHVLEVLQYYLPDDNTVAFSMHRTQAYSESDHQIEETLAAAQESIDAIHVNFTSQMICDLNLIYNQVCTFEQAMPYLHDMVTAVSENGAHLRLLVKSEPVDGVETSVALQLLRAELAERGLLDQVEVRFFNGPMHMKSTLIDDEFLIIGSQNFHYSAFGDTVGLTEYNMGTTDPQAIEEYKRLFEYHWERAVAE